MRPILFEAFGRQIASYGVFVILGAAAAWLLVYLLTYKSKGISGYDNIWHLVYAYLICICGAFAGAFFFRPLTRIPELIINFDSFKGAAAGTVMGYLFGEIVFYGGLIGGMLALCIYCKSFRLPVLPIADIFAPALALGHAFGRIGCFLGGCCYGIPVHAEHPFAVIFPANTAGGAAPGEPLLAVQLIEAACLFIIAAVLAVIYSKTADKQRAGLTVCMYGILYSVTRFVLEFYRGDLIRGVYGPLSTSQYVSAAIFIASTLFIAHFFIKQTKVTKMSQK